MHRQLHNRMPTNGATAATVGSTAGLTHVSLLTLTSWSPR
jgi:hypothetical protein